MAEALRDSFGEEVIGWLAAAVAAVDPAFDRRGFEKDARRGFRPLELMARGRHLAAALRRHLPAEAAEALAVLCRSLGARLADSPATGMAPFRYLPHVFFVRDYGLEAFDKAMDFQYELTQRFTAEWSIRPFLEQFPERTLARLRAWANDPSAHVRRLVSEGTRPRLPWAPRLRAFARDPRPVLALLELLRDDPAPYVRRSVANHLNDLGKDHRELLLRTCRRWLRGASAERRALVGRALRTLVGSGDGDALGLLGFGDRWRPVIEGVLFSPQRPRVGQSVRVSFVLRNRSRRRRSLLVDLRVFFVKANGRSSPKVFKLREIELPPRGGERLSKLVSLRQHTTRRHYPGKHRVEALVNGTAIALGQFTLRPAGRAR